MRPSSFSCTRSLGSVLMLLAIMAIYAHTGTTDIAEILIVERFPCIHANLVVARVLRLVRGQDADVAGPHLVAGCPRGSADGRLGGAGGHAAEDGRLRLPALLAADVPGCVRDVCAVCLRPVCHRHRLHLTGGADAGRHEKADRLLVSCPYGLRHHGHLLDEQAGHRWRHVPDDQPRVHLRCAVPVRRRGL
jgi:hypothetical protein